MLSAFVRPAYRTRRALDLACGTHALLCFVCREYRTFLPSPPSSSYPARAICVRASARVCVFFALLPSCLPCCWLDAWLWFCQEGMAKAQDDSAELKPIPLPYEMELVEMKIKDKKFVKIMQGKEPSQVRARASTS